MKIKTSVNKKYDIESYKNYAYKDSKDRAIKFHLLLILFLVNTMIQ